MTTTNDEVDGAPTDNGLTRVTVNLTARTMTAMARLRANGTSQTDVLNRSVQLAGLLDDYADPQTGRITLLTGEGERVHIHLVG